MKKNYKRSILFQRRAKGLVSFCFMTLLTLLSLSAVGQEIQVTGRVVSVEDGEPLPGVTVLEEGTSNGTITDIDGKYSLKVSGDAVLNFSFVGFKNVRVPVNSMATVDVKLEIDVTALEEVVVIGYGSIDRANITTAVASIDQDKIRNLPVPGIDQAIQGRLAGVTVSSNGGQPGGGVSVRVRGITSVNGNEPLYVIDGVPVVAERNTLEQNFLGGGRGQVTQSVLASINPADIQSIEVLKDASAQAIYGSRAANGVVLVTTRKGKSGEGKITYDGYYGVQMVPRKLSVMNLKENAVYIASVLEEINTVEGGSSTVNPELADPSLLGQGTDWQDEIYQQGVVQSHNISFGGGQNSTNYYFSLGTFDQTGILIGTDFKRYTLRGNVESDLKSWLTTGFSVNANRSNQRIGLSDAFDAVTSVVLYNTPLAPVRDANGDYVGQVQVGDQVVGNPTNPVAQARFRDVRSINSRAFGAIYGEIKFMKGLSLRNELNYDFNLTDNKAYQPFLRNEELNVNVISPSKLREERNQSIYYSLKNYLSYRASFGKSDVYVTLGHEAQHSQFDYIQASRQNLTLNLPSLAAGEGGDGSGELIGAGAGEWAMESWFGRINYSYADRYMVSATMRADGSSSFGPNSRWGYFPAVSAAWTVTNESFGSNLGFLSYLKVRAGYGSVGNQDVSANQYTANVDLKTISPFGKASLPANVPNPNLSWESVVTYNAGIDATFFASKILDVTVDVYKKVTTDMLLPTQLGKFSGLGTDWYDIKTPTANAGQITNTGIDVGITSNNFNRSNFKWSTTVVFSHYKNKLDYLNTDAAAIPGEFNEYGPISLVAYTQAGYPVGAFYGYVTDGLYTSDEELNSLETGLDVEPGGLWLGDIKYKDLDGDNDIDDEDVQVIGDPNPDFTLGLTNTFSYKGFDLSVFIYGSFGADIFNYTRRYTEGMNFQYNNQLKTVLDRYTADNTDATIPRYNQWHQNNRRISDRYIEDGTYVRIQNVQLGYTVPAAISGKAKISSLKVYVSAQNLMTFTDYSGYDPELGAINDEVDGGILINVDNGRYPIPRSFTFGVNVGF